MLLERFDEIDALDGVIDTVLTQLASHEPETDEYAKLVARLTELIKIKEIIGNLKLKGQDLTNKMLDAESTDKLKRRELKLRARDTAAQQKLREDEAEDRRIEWRETWSLKAKEVDLKVQESEKPDVVSKDTLALIGANIAGIVLILGYERVHVIASKALGFVMKR